MGAETKSTRHHDRHMNEIQYEVREQDLIAFNDHIARESAALQKQLHRHQAQVPGIIVLVSLLLWFYYRDTLSAIYVSVIALAWGFGVPAYLRWSLRKEVKKMYSQDVKDLVLGRFSLRVERSDLVETSAQGETRTPWSEILRIEATKKYAFIFLGPETALIIPRATIAKGDLHQFVRAADERIAQADAAV